MNAIRLSGDQDQKVNYTPSAAVAAGAIVDLGELLGVAERAIAANAIGALALAGVFKLVKDGSSGPVFALGDAVFWDTVNSLAVRTGGAGCLYFGTCTEAAATGQAWVNAALSPHNLPGFAADMLWEDVDVSSADLTLDIQDCGKVLNVTVGDATNGIILPACVAGLEYTIRCGTTGERVEITTDQAATADKVAGPDIAGTAGKGRILAAATSRKGDYVRLAFGGADTWMILAQRGVWIEEP
jgi:predicted RecA/RadA family phage recombinase